MKKNIYRVLILFLMFIFAFLSVAVSANTAGYVTDGLVAFYDGSDNLNGSHNKQSTVWKDSSGKANEVKVPLGDENKWTDNAFHLDSTKISFSDAIENLIKGDEFTFECVLDNFISIGSDFNTIIISENDNFHLFRRVSNDTIELKFKNNKRPITGENLGLSYLSSQVTITITFKLGGELIMYINGQKISAKPATVTTASNEIFFGNDHEKKTCAADIKSIRFYNKELTEAQITQNYNKDIGKNPGTGSSIIIPYLTAVMAFTASAHSVSLRRKKSLIF